MNRKIFEKIALIRIIAVAENDFIFEMLRVMPQLALDHRHLRVKFILFVPR
jgi:hypothetical protein